MPKLTKRNAGCLTEAVARLLNLHPECVPLFISRRDWLRSLRAFLRKHGLGVSYVEWDAETLRPNKIAIAVGQAAGTTNTRERHAVLYIGGKPFYDNRHKEKRPFVGPPKSMLVPYELKRRRYKRGVPPAVD